MPENRHPLDDHFRTIVLTLERGTARASDRPLTPGSPLTVTLAWELFEAQCESRQADFAATWMQSQGRGYYTIASAGHEANAGVAAALRPDDPALLHYRSGGFYCARARQRPGHDPARDIVLGVAAATGEPIAGGRHKVFGNADLAIIPQTSTIASHLPRAMGLAFAIARAKRIGIATPWPSDAIVVTSFGDASANHSSLAGAVNSASNAAYQGLPVPLLMVCEDNGIGISTPTPAGWIAQRFSGLPGVRYTSVDGTNVADVYAATVQAAAYVRSTRKPALLHLKTVRFLGHAGSDAELAYRTQSAISGDYARDPLLATARLLAAAGAADGAELLETYDRISHRVHELAVQAMTQPQLDNAVDVMAPLAPRHPDLVAGEVAVDVMAPLAPRHPDLVAGEVALDVMAPLAPRHPDLVAAAVTEKASPARDEVFGGKLPEDEGPLTLAQSINRTLQDELTRRPEVIAFGEDIAVKGGVYGVTRGLRKAFGGGRVFDTVLDEQSILGVALGAGLAGFLPVPEVQYLAYLHNAEDQLRGEAATLQFFSQGQYRNPMVVRIAGLGYQKGFGGHFHNDNSVAVLRDVPGLVVAVPSSAADAPALLRTLLAAARVDGTVGVLLEPIALYHTRDLLAEGDGGWLAEYAPPSEWAAGHIPIGSARSRHVGDGEPQLTIITFGNGVAMSLRVAHRLAERGSSSEVVDLRWLSPLPIEDILAAAAKTGRVLVVDETRRSGGVSESVITALVDRDFGGRVRRVTSEDSFIPLGAAARTVLLDEETIFAAAAQLLLESPTA